MESVNPEKKSTVDHGNRISMDDLIFDVPERGPIEELESTPSDLLPPIQGNELNPSGLAARQKQYPGVTGNYRADLIQAIRNLSDRADVQIHRATSEIPALTYHFWYFWDWGDARLVNHAQRNGWIDYCSALLVNKFDKELKQVWAENFDGLELSPKAEEDVLRSNPEIEKIRKAAKQLLEDLEKYDF